MSPSLSTSLQDTTDTRDQIVVTAIVATVHLLILFAWLAQPASVVFPVGEMSVQVTMQADTTRAAIKPESVQAKPVADESIEPDKPKQVEADTSSALENVAAQAATAPVVDPNAQEMTDVEPDYKASYLNNPRPVYPMVARRMGLQGKVVLNVEVLDVGQCGQVGIFQSSGYEVLDNAAMQTVKSWRFVPARQGGRAVTRWFKVPVVFSLRDSEA